MANKLACHAGDIVLLRVEIVGLGSDGPYVRVETGSGRATCFWAPTAAVARIEHAFDAPKKKLGVSAGLSPNDPTELGHGSALPPDMMNLERN